MTTMSAGEARLAERLERNRAEIERLAARVREDRRVIEETAQRLRATSPKADSLTRPLSSRRPLAKPTPGDPTADAWNAWQERLEQLDPRGSVYIRVSRIGEGPGPARGGGGHKLTFVTNLTDLQGSIEEEIERAAQLKGIWGPSVAVRLQPVSSRTNRYLRYPDGRSAVHELWLAIAPAPRGRLA